MPNILRAARANAILGVVNILVAAATSIVIARVLPSNLFAEYATMTALIAWGVLLTDASSSAGFAWMLKNAERGNAARTLYRALRLHRILLAPVILFVFLVFGQQWAHSAQLDPSIWNWSTLLLLAGAAIFTLLQQLSYYALINSFEHGLALGVSQLISLARCGLLVIAAVLYQTPAALAAAFFISAIVSAFIFEWLASRRMAGDEQLARGTLPGVYKHGAAIFLDKLSAGVGSGSFLLIVVAGYFQRTELALLAIASEFLQRSVSVANLPLNNMVMPYFNQRRGDPQYVDAVRKTACAASLILGCCAVAVAVFAPSGITLLYGPQYVDAASLALLLLPPMFFDAWTRMVAGFAVITDADYRTIANINAANIVASTGTLLLLTPYGLRALLIGLALVQITSSGLICIAASRRKLLDISVLPRGLIMTLLLALLAGWGIQSLMNEAPSVEILAGLGVAGVVGLMGTRFLVRLDDDILRFLANIAGARGAPVLTWLFRKNR